MDKVANSGPIAAWNKALHNAHDNDKLKDNIKQLEDEEYYAKLKQRGVNENFKKTELDKLALLGN